MANLSDGKGKKLFTYLRSSWAFPWVFLDRMPFNGWSHMHSLIPEK